MNKITSLLLSIMLMGGTVQLTAMQQDIAANAKEILSNACALCLKKADFQCPACKMVKYCSSTCQNEDWKRHKVRCAHYKEAMKILEDAFKNKKYKKAKNNCIKLFMLALDPLDETVIRALLMLKKVDLRETHIAGKLPLFYVTDQRNLRAIEFFLKNFYGQCDLRDDQGLTPLHRACQHDYLDVVKTLVELGSKLTAQGELTEELRAYMEPLFGAGGNPVGTPLHAAAMKGSLQCTQYLVETKPDIVDARTESGVTPLIRAVQSGHLEVARYLVQKSANLDAPKDTSDGGTLLHHALAQTSDIKEKDRKPPTLKMLKFLIHDCKIPLSGTDKRGDTALHWAATYGSVPSARLLIEEFHADISARNKAGQTPLELARYTKNHPLQGKNQYNLDGVIAYLSSL